MCGCYYVNDDTAREIEKLIRQVDEKLKKSENIHLQAGNIHPSEVVPVIAPIVMSCVADGRNGDSPVLAERSLSLMPEANQPRRKNV